MKGIVIGVFLLFLLLPFACNTGPKMEVCCSESFTCECYFTKITGWKPIKRCKCVGETEALLDFKLVLKDLKKQMKERGL